MLDRAFYGDFGTHVMGDYLMGAIGVLAFKPLFGVSDFKAGLVAVVNCDAIADDSASAVDAYGSPFGAITRSVLKGVCTTFMNTAADAVVVEFQKLQIKGATISAGRGVLYDTSTPTPDRRSDRVGDGTWTWTIGSAVISSSFAGDRIP